MRWRQRTLFGLAEDAQGGRPGWRPRKTEAPAPRETHYEDDSVMGQWWVGVCGSVLAKDRTLGSSATDDIQSHVVIQNTEERTKVKKRLQPMTQSRAIFTLTVGGKKERSRATSETRGEKNKN